MASEQRRRAIKLLVELEFLLDRYSNVPRKIPQPYYLQKVSSFVPGYKYYPEEVLASETHMDHVGSLPVIATAVYPYIKDDSIDLGRALTMLAIHDIGELITGDEMTFTKKPSAKTAERKAAFELLDPYYYDVYDEIDTQSSPTGRFAKAIDKIAPDIYDYLLPADNTIMRYKYFVDIERPGEIIKLIKDKKRPFMEWSPFMVEFHDLLLERLSHKLKSIGKPEKIDPEIGLG